MECRYGAQRRGTRPCPTRWAACRWMIKAGMSARAELANQNFAVEAAGTKKDTERKLPPALATAFCPLCAGNWSGGSPPQWHSC